MRMTLENELGTVKKVKIGFSWITLFFWIIPALLRKDLKWVFVMLAISAGAASVTFGITESLNALVIGAAFSSIIFSLLYNKIYIEELLLNGYRPTDSESQEVLESSGMSMEIPV